MTNQHPDQDVEDIRARVTTFFEAWNRRDVSQVVSLFTEDAEVVNSIGLWWTGLREVTRGLGAMNAIGPSLTPDSISARLVAENAAVCVALYTVASFTRQGGQLIPEQKAISIFFFVRRDDGWRAAGAQTTAVNAEVITQLKSHGVSV